jgi:DNA polymerase III subunit delta'
LLDLYDEAEALSRDAVRLAYDRVQVAMALADILARMGRIERLGRAQ